MRKPKIGDTVKYANTFFKVKNIYPKAEGSDILRYQLEPLLLCDVYCYEHEFEVILSEEERETQEEKKAQDYLLKQTDHS